MLLFTAKGAAAAPIEEELWTSCNSSQPAGQRCWAPRGVAADPDNGHVFVADQRNNRIVELGALGDFIRTWGWDVVASGPGDDAVPPGDQFEICNPEAGDACKEGLEGGGTGQSAKALGVALDSEGDVYVAERSGHRVQKFSSSGQFLLMFGGEVNRTKVEEREDQEANLEPVTVTEGEENLCPFDPGDACKQGAEGTGNGQFGEWRSPGDLIDVDTAGTETAADDRVWVGDQYRIQHFNVAGEYQSQISLPGESVQVLDLDAAGNFYVAYSACPATEGCEATKASVRKLSPTGEPLPTTFALPVYSGFFQASPTAVAVNSDGHVFVAGPGAAASFVREPIFEFDSTGNLVANFGQGEFNRSDGLATNLCAGSEAPGNLLATNVGGGVSGVDTEDFVRAYGTLPLGCLKARTLPASQIAETAATLNGTVKPSGSLSSECRFEWGTTTAYGNVAACAESPAQIGEGNSPVPVHADLSDLDAATVYHFRLRVKVDGLTETGLDEQFKTLGPPLLSEEHALDVTFTEAGLKALVNPEGFPTTHRFQYVEQEDFEAEGFNDPLETSASSIGSDRSFHPAIAHLAGLKPGSTYRWRAVATNTAALNGGVTVSEPHAFTTYRPVTTDTECPNQAFRNADSAFLPDCRAYEMVSPVDKNGGDIRTALYSDFSPGGYMQASPDGERMTYTAPPAFGDQGANLFWNQYLASRNAAGDPDEGWSTHGIHPPITGQEADPTTFLFGLAPDFMAFSPDLCSAWLIDLQTPPIVAEGQPDHVNLYRRQNCGEGAGSLEALTPASTTLPPGTPSQYVDNGSVQGASADSRHAFFVAQAPLTPQAAPGSGGQLYDRFDGANHLVSVLPGGSPVASEEAVVGSGSIGNLDNAVSSDGSRVYWSQVIANSNGGAGDIYLRIRPEQGIVAGECAKATKACTLPVSADLSTPGQSDAFFWTAAADGSRALYSEGSLGSGDADLYEFDLERAKDGELPRQVAANVKGVAGAGDDLSHVYFVSSDAIPGAGSNSEGAEAEAGEPNLYLYESPQGGAEASYAFVATLLPGDVTVPTFPKADGGYSVVDPQPYFHAARVSADGAHLLFQSRAALTGYDNTDAVGGEPAVEVFAYEAGGKLLCVSCNPSGARPHGRKLPLPYAYFSQEGASSIAKLKIWAAAWIPTWQRPMHASRLIAADGSRLFFNSNDALLPRDTNGTQDVYEWEAPGTGSCDEGDADYFPENGGCLYLISSGGSPQESEFWEADADGSDVFFTTESSLLPQDPGLIDLYDARAGGGFPQPVVRASCEGEACQSPPEAPNDPTPASASFQGAGNLREAKPRPRCPKGKRRARRAGKPRCVAKKKSAAKRKRAHRNRRAGR